MTSDRSFDFSKSPDSIGHWPLVTVGPMPFLKEFKKFAMRGNVIDLAVGVALGGAFNKIVNSTVSDIFMPVASIFTSKVDFKRLFVALDDEQYKTLEAARAANVPVITYGNFIQNAVEFLIIAFVIFLLVRQVNKLRPKPEPTAAPVAQNTRECPFCVSTISIKAKRCPQCTSQL